MALGGNVSRDQKFVIVALVLGNLILYLLAFYTVPSQSAGVSSEPTAAQIAAQPATPTPEFTSTPIATDTPSDTPTPELTATLVNSVETLTPSITPTSEITLAAGITTTGVATRTATATPTWRPTLPAGASLRFTPIPTRVRTPTATPKPAAPAGGTDPSNALQPGDAWRPLAANSSVWYKIGTGGNHLVANLQAQPIDGMQMEVYAPNIWDKPIGMGSRSNGVEGLVWAGGRWESYGDWFARVVNGNASAVTYRLMVNSNEIPPCEIIGYWEYIGTNYVYWKKCK